MTHASISDAISANRQKDGCSGQTNIFKEPRPEAFAVGVRGSDNVVGFTRGPYPDIQTALDDVPNFAPGGIEEHIGASIGNYAVIVWFKADWTDVVLYRWTDFKWVREPEIGGDG